MNFQNWTNKLASLSIEWHLCKITPLLTLSEIQHPCSWSTCVLPGCVVVDLVEDVLGGVLYNINPEGVCLFWFFMANGGLVPAGCSYSRTHLWRKEGCQEWSFSESSRGMMQWSWQSQKPSRSQCGPPRLCTACVTEKMLVHQILCKTILLRRWKQGE